MASPPIQEVVGGTGRPIRTTEEDGIMVEMIGGILVGLFIGFFFGTAMSADYRSERLEGCVRLNLSLSQCINVNDWGK